MLSRGAISHEVRNMLGLESARDSLIFSDLYLWIFYGYLWNFMALRSLRKILANALRIFINILHHTQILRGSDILLAPTVARPRHEAVVHTDSAWFTQFTQTMWLCALNLLCDLFLLFCCFVESAILEYREKAEAPSQGPAAWDNDS